MPGYGEDLAAIHAAAFTGLARAAVAELLPRLPPGARVLELGCGDGTAAAMLTGAGHGVHGIDLSPAFVERARRAAPDATFAVASFLDAPLPAGQDAVLAAGEVLAYRLDARLERTALPIVLQRCAHALRPGGILLFDLPAPDRAAGRTWREGDGWAVLAEAHAEGGMLTRRIVTFRAAGAERYRRAEETHALQLTAPADVLAALAAAGLRGEVLPAGYAGVALPPGLVAYLAERR